MGELQPSQGEVHHGTNVEMAYFDQLRAQLDESKSVLDNVGQGRDVITINGRARNLMGYLEDFLFTASVSGRRSVRFRAVSETACCWRDCLRSLPIC